MKLLVMWPIREKQSNWTYVSEFQNILSAAYNRGVPITKESQGRIDRIRHSYILVRVDGPAQGLAEDLSRQGFTVFLEVSV